jgi:ribosomal protein L16 Arg81 hydroxylase
LTPGNAAGFTPHYDVHEVLVLQIAGKKLWRIFAPSLKLPHRSQLFTPEAFRGQAPVAEIELQAGDLLYLPRGYLHATTTSDTFSAHVTIGITVYTWVDLVKQVLQSAIASEGLREALPPGFASRDDMKPILRQKMAEALEQLRADVDLDRLLESFTDRVLSSHVPRPEPFKANIRVVDLESTLATPSASSYKLSRKVRWSCSNSRARDTSSRHPWS